ncbi:tetraacyldisaccharide 4'-kinase [Pusillimonas sp. TS35]|uniref:tetraacyldisaccharide 4'-kinase n=1 Tax=Paracandidimonas lactea TaxID=2895524 RepID=UPI001368E427|nr:tetraacyldisaccharide 4'-kinase [Paracandidimonas lactea]MYN14717.1 tetraacyldisaccharide 4'-kinase [Pusillimonas sp. TS35]
MNLGASLQAALHRAWQHRGALSTLLAPLALLARAAATRKQRAYACHPERVFRAPVPVIVVGNIYVGGTGKTPVVLAVVQALCEQGWTPGIVSRGYGVRIGPKPRTGQGALDAGQFGDEPALIAAASGAPIAVHPDRPCAVRALLAAYPCVDVVVSDDGLQHLALARDIEIVVQDARGVGNGRMLPAGPLREPVQRLGDVDVIVSNLAAGDALPALPPTRARHVIMRLEPTDVEHLQSGRRLPWNDWLMQYGGVPSAAAAAIGNPTRYFAMLRHAGLQIAQTLALPDHYAYDGASPFATLAARQILITAKDAVKCRRLQDDRLWVVHARPRYDQPGWLRDVGAALDAARR